MPNTLQEVALDVISTEECASLMKSLPTDTRKIMCAMTPNKDTCQVCVTPQGHLRLYSEAFIAQHAYLLIFLCIYYLFVGIILIDRSLKLLD